MGSGVQMRSPEKKPAVAVGSEGLQLRNRSVWSWPILIVSGRFCFPPVEA